MGKLSRMNRYLPLLGIAVLALLLAGCAAPELRDTTLMQDDSLISQEPCGAPCWRGITPGETDWRDALTIVEDDADLRDLQIEQVEESDAVVAAFKGGESDQPCCQLLSRTGEQVDVIFLRIAPTTSLGDVIETWGEPTYAVGSPFSDGQAIMNLIFPDVPMVVIAFVAGESASVSASSEIIGVWYMTREDMDLLVGTTPLHFWDGYDTFQAYGTEEGTFDTTPSITLTPTADAASEGG